MIERRLALIGSYSGAGSLGLRSVWIHGNGEIEPVASVPVVSPTAIVWHPFLPIAYATNEHDEGAVTSVAVAEDGLLDLTGRAATGSWPCHAAVTPDGRWLLTADYFGASLSLIELRPDGGLGRTADTLKLSGSGPVFERQSQSHPHMIVSDLAEHFAVCVDLGADRLRAIEVSSGGHLREVKSWLLPPGTGPRQAIPHPDGETLLVLGELSAELLRVRLGSDKKAQVLETASTSGSASHNLPAQLTMATDGHHVLASNRGPDSISVFDTRKGRLERVGEAPCGGRWPRHFALEGDRLLVANERSNTIDSCELEGGGAQAWRHRTSFATPRPTWVSLRPLVDQER